MIIHSDKVCDDFETHSANKIRDSAITFTTKAPRIAPTVTLPIPAAKAGLHMSISFFMQSI